MTEASKESLTRAILGMTSSESEVRMVSATEIHRQGRALADHAVFPWWVNQELGDLLDSPNPHVTVGLAVTPERFSEIREACGSPRLADVPPDQDAQEFELHLPGGLSMDVLTTKDPAGNGAIAKFLHRFGEGIQQVEYRCRNVDAATTLLKKKFAVEPIYPQTRPGADGTRINFFLARTADGSKVLIELYEK